MREWPVVYKRVDWRISHEIFSDILDTLARSGYGNEEEAADAVRKKYGLEPYVEYNLIVQTEDERRRRSLNQFCPELFPLNP